MSDRVGSPSLRLWLASGAVSFLAAAAGCRLEPAPGAFFGFLPLAVALACVQWWGPRILAPVGAGTLAALLVAGVPPAAALASAVLQMLGGALSYALFRGFWAGDPRLPDQRQLAAYLFLGLLLPQALVASGLSVLALMLGLRRGAEVFDHFWQTWLVALTGSLALAVPLLSFGGDVFARRGWIAAAPGPVHERPRPAVFWGLSAWAAVSLFLAFHSNTRFTWPLLAASSIAVALRFGFAGSVWTCAVALPLVSVLAWSDFRQGHTSIFGLSDSAQEYLLILFSLGAALLVGRAMTDLRRTLRERVRAERALQLNNQVLATLPLGIAIGDAQRPELPRVYMNAALQGMGDAACDLERLLSRQDDETAARLAQAIAQGRETAVTLRSRRADGGELWDELTLSPLFDRQGRLTHYVFIHHDVTEREQARCELEAQRAALQRQTDMLNRTQRVARMGGWDWDVGSQTLTWTQETYLLLDYPPDEFQPSPSGAFKAFDEKSRLRLEQAIGHALADRVGFDLELRLHTYKGRCIWVRLSAEVELEGASVRRIYGFIQDIDDRKQAELMVEQQREWLRLYFDLPMVGLARTSGGKEWLEVNAKLSGMLGYAASELVGRRWSDFTYPDDLPAEMQEFSRMQEGEIEGYELDKRFVARDGTVFYAHVTMRGVRNGGGALDYCLTMVQDISERMEHQAEVARLAYYDELTGLPNRRMLLDRLERELARSQRYGYLGAVLFLDLDHFKTVNDSLGHPAGDALLQEISRRLSHEIREEDTLARLGGDEFVVLLVRLGVEPLEASENAARIARKLIEAVRIPMLIQGQELHSSTSIGVTLFPVLAEDCSAGLLKQADVALYRAKESGRNNYVFFSSSMQEAANQRLKLQNDLLRAVERGELELDLQPLVDLASGRPFGAEVLLRWRSPDYGLVPPAVFIPLAEEMGLIGTMGDWVLNRAAMLAKRWRGYFENGDLSYLAVNISARQMLKTDFADSAVSAVRANDIEARWLRLEITEFLSMRDLTQVVALMQSLRETGFCFSLDDFGTGYSSLTYLKRLPLDSIKIDRSFVHDVPGDDNASALVETIIVAARQLGLTVLAEGVETRRQADFLLRHGCVGGQGFLYGGPMRPELFDDYLATRAG